MLRLWDVLLLLGPSVLHQAAAALIARLESRCLAATTMEQAYALLTSGESSKCVGPRA